MVTQRTCFVVLFSVAASLWSDPASAQQGQAALIVGTVRDRSGGALGDATITVSSAALIGGPRTASTERNGTYRLPQLAPGGYRVRASAKGFRSVEESSVPISPGATATVDFVLDVEGVSESVDVSKPSPVDVRLSGAQIVISRAVLDNLPLNRSVTTFVNLAPGVIRGIAFGGSASANPFFLDGASGNEPGWGTPTVAPSASWLEELQVVTTGADARYGEYSGVMSNAITRSGSNRFSGTGEFWTTRQSWTSSNRGSLTPDLASRFVPLEVFERWTSIGQLGGPLKTDTLWFFGGVDYYKNENRPGGFASVAEAPSETRFVSDEPKVIAKLSGVPHPAVFVEGYFARDGANSAGANASPLTRPEANSNSRYADQLWSTRLTWTLNGSTLLEARNGGHRLQSTSGPGAPGGRNGPPSHYDSVTGIRSVNAGQYSDLSNAVISTSADLSHYAEGPFRQHHAFRFGYEFESASLHQESGYPGGMLYYDANGVPDQVYISAPSLYRPAHQRQTIYAEDGWEIAPQVTVNAGARLGFYRGGIVGMPTQFSASAVSPRIGLVWDVRPDHTLALRAHYGRYHEAMVTSFYDFLDPLSQPTFIDAKVVAPNQFSEIYRVVSNSRFAIDTNIKYPYVDEGTIGLERAVSSDTTVTAQAIHRRFGSIVGFIDTGSVWTPVPYQDPGPDGTLKTRDDGSQLTLYYNNNPDLASLVLTNPDGAYKHYDGLQLIVTRRASANWQGQVSYTWSRTRASFDNAFSSNAANNDLGANGVYVNPNRALFAAGRTSQDFTHELKAVGSLRLPRWSGVRVSAFYRLQSGMPWARAVTPAAPTELCCEAVEPRGTRTTPATNVGDLRVEKTFAMRSSTAGVYVDMFNIGNQGIATRYDFRSGPTFGTPSGWSDPRIIRLGMRVTF